jgi:hypothetical protein
LPSSRVITWQDEVGVEGGIPTRSTVYQTLGVAGQISTYAQSVTASQINTALDNCPTGQVVYLNRGTYTLSESIVMPSNKVLRGAGIDQTILEGGSIGDFVLFSGGYTDTSSDSISNITSGATKGSTSITLENATAFPASGFVYVDELNDTGIPVDPDGTGGTWTGGVYPTSSTRNWAVEYKITGKSGNVLYIDPPFVHDWTFTPRAINVSATYIQSSGLEDLTIHNVTETNVGVHLQGAANCWVKNVKIYNLGLYGIHSEYDAFRNTFQKIWFKGAINQYDSNRAYSIHFVTTSFSLVESCLFDHTANGVVIVSSTGNVFAYNYSIGVHRTNNESSWFWSDYWTHGCNSAYNLYEGNTGNAQNWDAYFGGASYNTSYRNRWTSKDSTITYDGTVQTISAIATSQYNYYTNSIGNVLGTSGWNNAYENNPPSPDDSWTTKPIYAIGGWGWDSRLKSTMLRHRNYDFYSNTIKNCDESGEPGCQSGDTDSNIPNSLYLTSKPSWFGSQTWPPVDPTSPTLTSANKIPAQVFYETGSWPTESGTSTITASGIVPSGVTIR